MPFITTNDNVSIYYEIHGEGKPLFMLPGWTCSTKFWKYNVDALARHFQIVLMDMRGHGGIGKKCSTAIAFPGMPWT